MTEPTGSAATTTTTTGWWLTHTRALLTLAFPLILTNFAYVALTTVDIVMLGRLGTLEIAAAGLAVVRRQRPARGPWAGRFGHSLTTVMFRSHWRR